ncbi:hypothetical protein [Aeropyrum camini]|uniref:hypothetical protein n=1 Tax=Aeropyrum camini TaxID=229980 RepID=UPI00210F00CA|nr:hypothetical protein [Aeropyrum camini]
MHARRASRGSPRGTANAHPFAVKAVMRDGVMEFYLAHNGSLEKSSLAASLGVRAEGYTDSHLLALSIAREAELTGEDLSGLLAKHYEHVKTAYNIAVLTLKDSAGRLEPALYLAAGSRDDLGEEVKRYYQHFIFEDSGAAGMASSTVYHLALREGVAGRLGTSFSPAGGGVYRIAPQARGVERLRNL